MAKASYRKLVDVPKKYLIIMMESGYVYLAMRRTEEAKEVFEGVAALTPKSEIPVIALGNVYAAEQDYEKALQNFRKASRLNTSSALAFAHIGEMLLLLDRKKDAHKALEKALELESRGKAAQFAKSLLDADAQGIFDVDLETDAPQASFPK